MYTKHKCTCMFCAPPGPELTSGSFNPGFQSVFYDKHDPLKKKHMTGLCVFTRSIASQYFIEKIHVQYSILPSSFQTNIKVWFPKSLFRLSKYSNKCLSVTRIKCKGYHS